MDDNSDASPDQSSDEPRGHTETDLESDELSGAPRRPGNGSGAGALPVRSRHRYEVLGEHAHGGLGKISRARDRELGRSLAIKEIKAPHPTAVARFVREAQITMRLEHPSIVPVHDAGRWETGEPFYAMKLVSGRTLKEVVQEKTTLAERMTLLPNVIAVADAIAYAHDQRVIHRDLKASNVLVGAFGETIVIDWGLAKDLMRPDDPADSTAGPYRKSADETVAGAVVGTPSFMPPEQARGEEVDERADVYALGALLYYALSGKAPHEGGSSAQVLERVRAEPPAPIAEVAAGIPADLAAIVGKAMARDKETRYPSAQQLARDLKRFQAGQLVAAHHYSPAERIGRWIRRHRAIAAATVLFVVVAAAGLAAFAVRESGLRRTAETERDRADQKTLALLEQQGRAELHAGRPFRAAVFLSDAFRRNPTSLALRSLLTQAVRPMATLERQLVGHEHDVPDIAYSPDGSLIVTASTDKTARIWSADTGELLHVLQHDRPIDAAEFSADGSLVVTGSYDKGVRIWDADTGRLVRRLEDDITAFRVSLTPDGCCVVEGSQQGVLRVRDIQSGKVLLDSTMHKNRISQIAYSPDGSRMLVGAFDRTASIWDLASFQLLQVIDDFDREVVSVAYSHDGRWMLTAESQVYLHLRDGRTGKHVYSIRLPEGASWPDASFSPDDRTIITSTNDGVVRTWHTTSGALLRAVDPQPLGKLMASTLRPDGRELATAGIHGRVSVWALDDTPGYRLLEHPTGRSEHLQPSEYTLDGKRIITAGGAGTVSVWDAASGQLQGSFQVPGEAFSLATNRDGSRILATGTHKVSFPPALWDFRTGQRVAEITGHARMVYNAASSADGTTFATSSYDGSIRLFDAQSGQPRGVIEPGKDEIPAIAFSPSGTEIAAVTANGKLLFIDRESGLVRRSVDAHPTWIQDVEYSRDGKRVITAGRQDHTARVWNVATGELELTLSGHNDNLSRGSFSPDGTLIATSGMDHIANVWDARTGELLRSIPGPSFTAVFSPDGKELLTTGYDGYAVVWDLMLDERSADELAEYVHQRSPWELVDGRLELRR